MKGKGINDVHFQRTRSANEESVMRKSMGKKGRFCVFDESSVHNKRTGNMLVRSILFV